VSPFVLLAAAAVGEIARGDDDVRGDIGGHRRHRMVHVFVVACTHVQIGYVQDARRHSRMRL